MVFIRKILLIKYTINQCSIVCCPIQCNFIAPLVTAVTYVYVFIIKWVNLDKVVYIYKHVNNI